MSFYKGIEAPQGTLKPVTEVVEVHMALFAGLSGLDRQK